MRLRTRVITVTAVLLCLISVTPASLFANIKDDKRLGWRTLLTADSTPIGSILEKYSGRTMVKLSAEPVLADTPISARLSSRPINQILQSIADLVLGEWRAEGDGYILVRSQRGLLEESQITAWRDWSIAEQRDRIIAALKVPTADWQKVVTQCPWENVQTLARSGRNFPEMPEGFVFPDDYNIALALSSPFRSAVLDLAASLPLSTWEQMRDGIEIPASELHEAKRKILWYCFTGPAPDVPGTDGHKEQWPDERTSPWVTEVLEGGKDVVFFQLHTDGLGRWYHLDVWARPQMYQVYLAGVPIGKCLRSDYYVPDQKPCFESGKYLDYKVQLPLAYTRYRKILPESDEPCDVLADMTCQPSCEYRWPVREPPMEDYSGYRNQILFWMGSAANIDYISTRLDYSHPHGLLAYSARRVKRADVIDQVAESLDCLWERCGGVYLLRERDWPLLREQMVPPSFYKKYTEKLSPDMSLAMDDIATAYTELSAKQLAWMHRFCETLPFRPYVHEFQRGNRSIYSVWLRLNAVEREKMIIGTDWRWLNPGLPLTELEPDLQATVLDIIRRKRPITGVELKPEHIILGRSKFTTVDGSVDEAIKFKLNLPDKEDYEGGLLYVHHPTPIMWFTEPVKWRH